MFFGKDYSLIHCECRLHMMRYFAALVVALFSAISSVQVLAQEQVVSTRGKSASPISIEDLKEQTLDVKTRFSEAQKLYRSKIAKHWADIKVTGDSRWVSYSQDWLVRRQVDFHKSQIELSIQHGKLSALDRPHLGLHAALRAHAEDQLDELLNMTVRDAYMADPSLSKLLKDTSSKRGGALLLGALFDDARPNKRVRQMVKSALLEKAYVRYPTVASSMPSMNFGSVGTTDFIIPLPKRFSSLPPWLMAGFKEQGLSSKNDQQVMQAISFAATRNNIMSAVDGEHFGLLGLSLDSVMAVQPQLLLEEDLLSYLLDPRDNMSIGVRYYLWLLNEFGGVRKGSKRRFMVAAAFYLGKDRLLDLLSEDGVEGLNKYSMKSIYQELVQHNNLSRKEQTYLADLVDYRKKQVLGG